MDSVTLNDFAKLLLNNNLAVETGVCSHMRVSNGAAREVGKNAPGGLEWIVTGIAGGKVEYRVLTVNREFGSGGGRIAQTIAEWLGWKLLDRDIIDAIAYAAHVDSNVVRHYDEHVDSWLRRINQQAMRSAALAAGLELGENSVFDAQEMVKISQKIIEEALHRGQLRDCGPRLAMRAAVQARRISRFCLRILP